MIELLVGVLCIAILVVAFEVQVILDQRRHIKLLRRELKSKSKFKAQLLDQLAEVDEWAIATVKRRRQLGPDEWPDTIDE